MLSRDLNGNVGAASIPVYCRRQCGAACAGGHRVGIPAPADLDCRVTGVPDSFIQVILRTFAPRILLAFSSMRALLASSSANS
jgi:hypothetical protein